MKLGHLFSFLLISLLLGQTYPVGQNYPPPTDLITAPTAATLMRGSFSLGMRIQDAGGMIIGLRAGITDRFQFGLSYGSPNLIGDDSLRWYPRPEANLKYLLVDETITLPEEVDKIQIEEGQAKQDIIDLHETNEILVDFPFEDDILVVSYEI